MAVHYWLKYEISLPWREVSIPWEEVTEEKFIAAERAAGFRGREGKCATGGFFGGGIEGRITGDVLAATNYGFDPEFIQAARKAGIIIREEVSN